MHYQDLLKTLQPLNNKEKNSSKNRDWYQKINTSYTSVYCHESGIWEIAFLFIIVCVRNFLEKKNISRWRMRCTKSSRVDCGETLNIPIAGINPIVMSVEKPEILWVKIRIVMRPGKKPGLFHLEER